MVHTHRASVHQAAKPAAALLRVVRVTAGLAASNGSLLPGLWLTSPAGWLPGTGISSGTLHSVIEYGQLPDATVLQFWEKGCQYPVLAQVADIYLAMSLSSIFSTTGIILNSESFPMGRGIIGRSCTRGNGITWFLTKNPEIAENWYIYVNSTILTSETVYYTPLSGYKKTH